MATGEKDIKKGPELEVESESEALPQQQPLQQLSEAQAVLGINVRTDSKVKNVTTNDGCGGGVSVSVDPPVSTKPMIGNSPAARNKTSGDSAIENPYFFEDEIFRFDKKGRVKFGLIIDPSGAYSGDEDDDYDGVLKGEVRVAWYPDGKEEALSEATIALADRTLMPGDVVRRLVPGKDTQRGYCREISMYADVRVLGTKYVIKNVMAERLRPINQWQRDSAVCLDSWVGSTKDVEEKAVLRASSGARIEISSNDFYAFTDFNAGNTRGIYNPHVFYPGNVVIGRLPSLENVKLLTPNVPIHKNRKGKPFKGKYTVESVVTDSVWVHWQCKALSDDNNIESSLLEQPNPCVTGEDLKRMKRLNLFESCMLQISDRNFLKYSKLDTIIKKSQWDKEQAVKFKLILAQQQKDRDTHNVCVRNDSAGNNSTTHHIEKSHMKPSQVDADKTSNSKKFAINADKLSNSGTTEKLENNKSASGQSGNNIVNNTVNPTNKNSSKQSLDTGWVTDDEDDVDDEYCDHGFDEDGISTTTTCSSPSPHNSPKHMKRRLLRKKGTANMKKPSTTTPEFAPKDGDELVTEALLVYSTATVVWQDGSIETGIPSTQLYPIHHLDNHEFFPGDLVICGKEGADVSYRDYGVIQTVDHHGRTAHVKWFTTYTSADEPKPAYKGESEVSVYDVKDHPDFQYRPGTMVIRVANFVGEDANCTAGQIIDNYIDGRAKVWWVDGHISMCWPQDLFEVGQYDNWGHESEDSWETESENSELGNASPKLSMDESDIISNIERARMAIMRLQDIFTFSPILQSREMMRKLLSLFKSCRYLDRLLNTTFFHEDNFEGLIERVRKSGTQTVPEVAEDSKDRLFSYLQPIPSSLKPPSQQPLQSQCHHQHKSCQYQAIVGVNNGQKLQDVIGSATNVPSSKEYAPKILLNISSSPLKCPACTAIAAIKSTTDSTESDTGPSDMENFPPIPLPPGVVISKKQAKAISTLLALNRKMASSAESDDSMKSESREVTTPIFNQKTDSDDSIKSESREVKTPKCNQKTESVTTNNVNASSSMPMKSPLCPDSSGQKQSSYIAEKNQLLNSAMLNLEKAFEGTSQLKLFMASSQDDSGNVSRNENCDGSSTSYASSLDPINVEATVPLTKCNDDQKSCYSIELNEDKPELVCVRLCALLREQLVKCISEIRKRYYKEYNLHLSDVFDFDPPTRNSSETVIKVQKLQEVASEDANVHALAKSLEASCALGKETTKDSELLSNSSTCLLSPTSTAIVIDPISPADCFQVLPGSPIIHRFHFNIFHPHNARQYYRAVQREHRMLKNSLPPGVWVRVFEDRMDLLSVMIEGPKNTPYENGLFFFDIQLGREYPKTPPQCYYISYCKDRLNPNLYEDGKVCVSLLGTWTGRDTEMWGPKSTLLQVIVSIQGLILVPEPYFNEAGYDKQKGTQQGNENSRMYNEMAIIKMVQATTKLLQEPHELFCNEIMEYYKQHGMSMYERIKGWVELSKQTLNSNSENAEQIKIKEEQHVCGNAAISNTVPNTKKYVPPDFTLIPASRGFCLTLADLLDNFKSNLETLNSKKVGKLPVEDGGTSSKQ